MLTNLHTHLPAAQNKSNGLIAIENQLKNYVPPTSIKHGNVMGASVGEMLNGSTKEMSMLTAAMITTAAITLLVTTLFTLQTTFQLLKC